MMDFTVIDKVKSEDNQLSPFTVVGAAAQGNSGSKMIANDVTCDETKIITSPGKNDDDGQ